MLAAFGNPRIFKGRKSLAPTVDSRRCIIKVARYAAKQGRWNDRAYLLPKAAA
jgi:hypothetical protein